MPYQRTTSEEKMFKDCEIARTMFNQLESEFGPELAYNSSLLREALAAAEISEQMISLVIGVLTEKNTQFNGALFMPRFCESPPIPTHSNLTTPESYSNSGSNSPTLFLPSKTTRFSAMTPKIG